MILSRQERMVHMYSLYRDYMEALGPGDKVQALDTTHCIRKLKFEITNTHISLRTEFHRKYVKKIPNSKKKHENIPVSLDW